MAADYRWLHLRQQYTNNAFEINAQILSLKPHPYLEPGPSWGRLDKTETKF
jgi:hypothetical protein